MSKHAEKLLSTNSSSTICHSYRVKAEKDRNNYKNFIQKYLKNSKEFSSIDILTGRYSLGNINNSKVIHCRRKHYDSLSKIE